MGENNTEVRVPYLVHELSHADPRHAPQHTREDQIGLAPVAWQKKKLTHSPKSSNRACASSLLPAKYLKSKPPKCKCTIKNYVQDFGECVKFF